MPKDKDFKRLVRDRMAETGERYMEARAKLRPDAADDWKEAHIERADSFPTAVWRVFAAPEGEPLDIRQRFFSDPANESEHEAREQVLRQQVITTLNNWRRQDYAGDSPGRPSAVTGLEMFFHDAYRLRRTSSMGSGPADAPRLPIDVLAARALTQVTGEAHEPVSVTARYRVAATDAGTVDRRLEVVGKSVPVTEIRRAIAERLTAHPTPPGEGRSIDARLFDDGEITVMWRSNPSGLTFGTPDDADPTLPNAELLAAALAGLSD